MIQKSASPTSNARNRCWIGRRVSICKRAWSAQSSISERNSKASELPLMRIRFSHILVAIISFGCLAILGYRFYRWHQDEEKRKQLFSYFQSASPITRRMPADTLVYADFLDLNRVYSGLQQTDLYQVVIHWLDTGMSNRQKANPVMGS